MLGSVFTCKLFILNKTIIFRNFDIFSLVPVKILKLRPYYQSLDYNVISLA